MSNSSLCVDANLVIRLVADPADEAVRDLWEQWDAEQLVQHIWDASGWEGYLARYTDEKSCR